MANARYLILKGIAGLGNRLLTVAAGIHYSRMSQRVLVVDWSDGMYGPVRHPAFGDLFELPGIDYLTAPDQIVGLESMRMLPESYRAHLKQNFGEVYRSDRTKLLRRLISGRLLPRGRCRMLHRFWRYIGDGRYADGRSDNTVRGALAAMWRGPGYHMLYGHDLPVHLPHDVVVYVDFSPMTPDTAEIVRQHIRPVEPIRVAVDEYATHHRLAERGLGLHIRHTDKQAAADFSALFALIDARLPANGVIFLATDNPTVRQTVVDRFGAARVLSQASVLPELNRDGTPGQGGGIHHRIQQSGGELAALHARESVLDIWQLSRCRWLFHQGNSSFSQISRYLHAAPDHQLDWREAARGS